MSNATTDRPAVGEFNGLVNGQAYHADRHAQKDGVESVDWSTRGLRVTRFRLLSDPGFPAWDVSYCHGLLDGRHVDVILPFSQLRKRVTYKDHKGVRRTGGWKADVILHAKADGVNAKGLGILDAGSTLC